MYLRFCTVHLEDTLTCQNYVQEEQLTNKYNVISNLILKESLHTEGI